ncbi:hypothetical protein [Nocardia camponoti]|uniref:Uncharacterized protein n=1 Tax=Nocardia camponoti TaxID=1616106 RepID=A0A917QJH1_9NOCA|nr:hypothetical protein [Nocardia camponoti]GGK53471.1 hypothetical protein GCM10011591_26640 [Nocardia camponoti]
MSEVRLRHETSGLVALVVDGSPVVGDGFPALDTLVLEVFGGYLSWSLLGGQRFPSAVLDDVEAAQDWLWAVYGESVAIRVFDSEAGELEVEPVVPGLVDTLRRLAYAHWASRWWPASLLDGIGALSGSLLADEIAGLVEEAEVAVAGSDAVVTVPELTSVRSDYALAAGGTGADGLVLARGVTGWDWRRCPPGILDASEQAVSWELSRLDGVSTVTVRAVCAPDCALDVPEYLHPHVRVELGDASRTVALSRFGDQWLGAVVFDSTSSAPEVTVYVPGVGPSVVTPDEVATRELLRAYARERLASSSADLLVAEVAARDAEDDY